MSDEQTITDEQAVNRAREIHEEVKGHDSIVITDEDGTEYTLCYPRKTVKQMEAAGFSAAAASQLLSSGTLTGTEQYIEKFVMPAFKKHHPGIKLDDVIGIWERVSDKVELSIYLTALFMQPTLALTTDPTQTRATFRLV